MNYLARVIRSGNIGNEDSAKVAGLLSIRAGIATGLSSLIWNQSITSAAFSTIITTISSFAMQVFASEILEKTPIRKESYKTLVMFTSHLIGSGIGSSISFFNTISKPYKAAIGILGGLFSIHRHVLKFAPN